jgi:hypothetical protein
MSWLKRFAQSIADRLEDIEGCNLDELKSFLDENGISYDTVDLPEFGKDIIFFKIGRVYTSDTDEFYPEPIEDLLLWLSNRDSYYFSEYFEKHFPSVWEMDFGDYGDGYAYHYTRESRLNSILRDGLIPRDETRGMGNRHAGSAVFLSMGIPTYSGEVLLRIDIPAMIKDGYLPQASLEEPVIEKMVMEHIARRFGVEYQHHVESGMEENTIVVYGVIPPKYISVDK